MEFSGVASNSHWRGFRVEGVKETGVRVGRVSRPHRAEVWAEGRSSHVVNSHQLPPEYATGGV